MDGAIRDAEITSKTMQMCHKALTSCIVDTFWNISWSSIQEQHYRKESWKYEILLNCLNNMVYHLNGEMARNSLVEQSLSSDLHVARFDKNLARKIRPYKTFVFSNGQLFLEVQHLG